jgi:hypothetical protein
MDQQSLGDRLAVFQARRGVLIGGIIFAVLNACLGAFIMAGALFVPVKPRVNPMVQRGLFIGVGAFMVSLSAYLIFHVARHIGLRVSLHRGGLAILQRGNISVVAWDEIEAVWHKQAVNLTLEDALGSLLDGSQSRYTLRTTSGKRIVLDSLLRDHPTLGCAIRRETTLRLLPQARRAYNVEGRVEFGKLSVGREGLAKGSKILPWSDVGCVVIQNGFVLVKRRNGRLAWFGVPMSKVPNLYVYFALVQTMLGSHAMH